MEQSDTNSRVEADLGRAVHGDLNANRLLSNGQRLLTRRMSSSSESGFESGFQSDLSEELSNSQPNSAGITGSSPPPCHGYDDCIIL